MKSLLKFAASVVATALAFSVKADYLAWSLNTNETFDYAKIYYAQSAEAAEKSTALTSYLDNTGSGDAITQVSSDYTGITFFADLTGTGAPQDGYNFYVLLYNANNQVSRVSDPIAYAAAQIVAQHTGLGGNTVTSGSYSGGVAQADSFNIPEPTSGLLFLIGSTALLLRRKRV